MSKYPLSNMYNDISIPVSPLHFTETYTDELTYVDTQVIREHRACTRVLGFRGQEIGFLHILESQAKR
jgi:hypothetical protein